MSYGCGTVPGGAGYMGGGQPSLPHHPTWDIPACLRARAEGGRTYDWPKLLTWPSKAGPQGRCLCHLAGRASDQ